MVLATVPPAPSGYLQRSAWLQANHSTLLKLLGFPRYGYSPCARPDLSSRRMHRAADSVYSALDDATARLESLGLTSKCPEPLKRHV